ncbi:MAG: hypothetical protein HeimC3_42770 [Candidatus Heimdallarchaeota archaeon LC_3]|nr:MAG: hypothetical protein HeimC3_42770 [Candidatus Heimdallarchaeota archaeon LC_3]
MTNIPSSIHSQSDFNLKKFVLPIILILMLLFLRDFLGLIVSRIITDLTNPGNDPKFDLLLNLLLNVVIVILMLVIILILIKLSILNLNPQTANRNFGIKETFYIYLSAFSLVFVFGFIITTLSAIINNIPESSYESITLVSENLTIFNVLLLFILIIILAPIFEEFVFRRILIPLLEGGHGTYGALIISSLCFGLIHTDNDLVNGNAVFAFIHGVNAIILGLGLGFVYILTRNIIYPILFHGFNNFLPFITQLLLAYLDIDISAEVDPNRLNDYAILSILSLLLIVQTIVGLVIIGKVLFNGERKKKINLFIEQIPSSVSNSLRNKILIGLFVLLIFIFFTVIWSVFLRKFIYEDIFKLNSNDAFIFVILSDLVFIFLFIIILYLFRSTINHLTSIKNPKIDLDKLINETHLDETKSKSNEVEIQKFCVYCGSKLLGSSNFCINCGKKRVDI